MSDAVEDELRSFRGHTRLFLVFGPSETDPQVTKQLEAFRGQHDSLNERDTRIFSVLEGSAPTAGASPASWRKRFDVGPSRFTAVLVGKDGTEKKRWIEPVSLADLQAEIDAMPMRQQEAQQQQEQA